MRDNDTVEEVVHVMDHDTVLFFSPDGICRSLKAYQIPVSSKTAMGAPLTQVPALILPHRLSFIYKVSPFIRHGSVAVKFADHIAVVRFACSGCCKLCCLRSSKRHACYIPTLMPGLRVWRKHV